MPDFNTMQRRRLAAKNQAMPDGGFPIRNVSDLKNAIQAYGRAMNKPAVKAWIKKRAKALGREDLLPDNWRTDTVSHSEKGVYMWTYNYSDPDYICHYGVKGMKWGVRKDPSKAYGKASKKAKKLQNRVDKANAKLTKYNKKLEKAKRRYSGWGRSSNKNLLRQVKRTARWERKLGKRTKKLDKWMTAMEKNFSNVKLSDISDRDRQIGKDYLNMLSKRKR